MTDDTTQLPGRRTKHLVIVDVADELVIYDEETHQAHALNGAAAAVWRALDDGVTIAQLTGRVRPEFGGLEAEDGVWLALRDLSRRKLLDGPLPRTARLGVSRRQALRQLVAAGFVAPAVVSIRAPHAYAIASATVCANPIPDCNIQDVTPYICGSTECFCITTTENTNVCVAGACIQACTTSADCPPGSVCWNINCCAPTVGQTGASIPGAHVCLPLCGTFTVSRSMPAGRPFWRRG